MVNLSIIKQLAKDKNISLEELAEKIGKTPQGLYKLIRENSTKVDTLEDIASALDAPVTIFFGENAESYHHNINISNSSNVSDINNDKSADTGLSASEHHSDLMEIIKRKDEQIERLLKIIETMGGK